MKKLILLLFLSLSLTVTVCFAEEGFNPFPLNTGSIYEYDSENLPEVWFFPVEEARWDGYEVTLSKWSMLTDFQKAQFISEGLDLLISKGVLPEQEGVDVWRMIIAMNHMASSMGRKEPQVAMIAVIRDLLVEN
ncbi:MAG: hypothetical protein PHQ52_07940 [Candidatus Omnitrophica bacterium]|nr:hypothetical protein [Candidatus Omnitrophota bacterium]